MKSNLSKYQLKELKIEVTDACNLACKHCSSLSKTINAKTIQYEKVVSIIDEAVHMGVEEIKFSGGEPLLWARIEEIIKLVNNYKIKSTIYTTGNVPDFNKKLNLIKAAGIKRIIFTLFDSNPIKHEKVTLVKGSFNNTIEALKKCAEFNIKTEIHFVPFASNYQYLPELAKLSREVGAEKISILRLVPQGRAKDQMNELLSTKQNIELKNIILDLRKQGYNIRIGSPYNFLNIEGSVACCSGIEELTIRPDLTICPCDAFKGVSPLDLQLFDEYYSLSNNTLYDCWHKSTYLNKVREYVKMPVSETCSACKMCDTGCLGQKFYKYGKLTSKPDPMCLGKNSQKVLNC